ncbi:hypothetical protein GCM10009533_04060 [Saccharopolyspora spinosporotrichia]|uniref:Amidohydrolase 3 domain-containing protein n=1 Tax=Saccharopolyspora erythraea TaxID=1836 RepID=A0ABP3LWN5_SACER|nr:twin-arginine translocation pathway signal protein [Saccharopolyspora erythraea D]QRK91379.1 amidohydrolase family protein [Saccharopolyspora erythraea]
MTRRTAGRGVVLGAAERITVEEALRAVTIDAAWQLRSEHEVGSVEVGKQADFVVLSADPRAVEPEEIGDIEVLRTYLSGRPTS